MKLDQRLRKALESRGLAEPTPAQVVAWPHIAAGKHTLLIAPTGVGKTEAAVVPLLDSLLRQPAQPLAPRSQPSSPCDCSWWQARRRTGDA